MSQQLWDAVDEYTAGLLIGRDPVLEQVLSASEQAGLPPISVTANQGRLLELLARIRAAGKILELGTLGGYSTIWLARGLRPGGRLVTLELNGHYAQVASANLARAGLADRVELLVGPALDSLQSLLERGEGPFDLVFIDADKARTADYFDLALELTAPGSVLVADNAVRGGAVADPDTEDPSAQGMRRFFERLAAEPRVTATTIQTVGAKGYDGFTLALVE